MATAIISEDLKKLWERPGITFDNFNYITQDRVNDLMEKFPKKFSKDPTSGTGKDEPKTRRSKSKSPGISRSAKTKGVEPNEWAEILHLNSGDNELALYIYETLNSKYQLTIAWVSSRF